MSYHSQFSIWNGESSKDTWYSNSIASRQELKPTPGNMLYATQAAFNRDSTALPSASFYDDTYANEAMIGHDDSATRNKYILRVSTDKPLPDLPKVKDPYFDYMFADAEFSQQNEEEAQIANPQSTLPTFMDLMSASPRQLSFNFEYASSPPECLPSTPTNFIDDAAYYGFDGTAIKRETPTSPTFDACYIIDHAGSTPFSFVSVNPIVKTTIDPLLDSAESEIADATAGFYGGYAVEESPSPYHAPNIDDGAGFGDIRDGCEHFPEQWTDEETQAELVAPYKATANQSFSEDFELLASKPLKPVLQPKSQIAKAARTCDMGFGYTHRATYTPRLTALSGFSDEVVEKINGTKRRAQDTILSTSNENLDDADYDDDEEDEEPQSTKKARLSSHSSMDADAVYGPMPSTFSLFPDLKRKTSTCSISNSTFHHTGAFAPTVDGYPGQFRALIPPSKIFHPNFLSGGRPDKVTFGNKTHANSLFHHTRFQPGGNTPWNELSLDFSQSAIPSIEGPVGKALKLADENLIIAADTERTAEEEKLRRETHFECSLARLEGVSVGEYRYYQGHSSIEEYNQGGMCICWDECFCTTMCTRYADMLCPCKKYIEFEE